MKKEKSCGIIVFHNDKVLMVKQLLGHWGFPKGHIEKDETEYETALREVKEETNIDARIIDGFRKVISYSPKEGVIKYVTFFIGEPLNYDTISQENEIEQTLFVPIGEAINLVTYEEEKEALNEAIDFIKKQKEEK